MKILNAGIVGCGGFTRGMTVPVLSKNPKYRIRAVADIDEQAAKTVAADTGAINYAGDIDRLLGDADIDAVFINTRHNTHAELSVRAANAKKHILCEKPMGLSRGECRAVAEAVRFNGVKYCIGYNRGMAPMITRARELLAGQPEKKMAYHRIQAPFPAEHWTHLPHVGGGRFVGEGCHIFDMFCELIGCPPVSVYASGGTFLDPEDVKIPDSACVTLTFADGSVCVTLIASAGCPSFPKEATEIYCAGRAIFINDFKAMEYYGYEGRKKTELIFDETDKGHSVEADLFANAIIDDTPPPNGIAQAARAAVISYKVNESIASGSAVPISENDYAF